MASFRMIASRRLMAMAVLISVVGVLAWWLTPSLRGLLVHRELAQPFYLEFGRGSGWHGLDTVKVLEDGTAILHRVNRDGLETTTLELSQNAVGKIHEAIARNRLLDLDRRYVRSDIADGTQWVLRVRDNNQEKSVYFDNRFPAEIRKFADELDVILAENGLEEATWRQVEYPRGLGYAKELWDSIKD